MHLGDIYFVVYLFLRSQLSMRVFDIILPPMNVDCVCLTNSTINDLMVEIIFYMIYRY